MHETTKSFCQEAGLAEIGVYIDVGRAFIWCAWTGIMNENGMDQRE